MNQLEKFGQTSENLKQQTGDKAETSSAKSSRRKTAMDISARILEELSSSGNSGQTQVITFGSCVQDTSGATKPIKWKVLEKKGKSMLLLSDRILDVKPYHGSNIAVSWEGCDLRTWLNVDFVKEAFRGEEEFLLKYAEVENHIGNLYDRSVYKLYYDDSNLNAPTIKVELPDKTPCILVYTYNFDKGALNSAYKVKNEAQLSGKNQSNSEIKIEKILHMQMWIRVN